MTQAGERQMGRGDPPAVRRDVLQHPGTRLDRVLRLTDTPGVRVVFSGAEENTESAERLRLLATPA